jgi:hypothetical protein
MNNIISIFLGFLLLSGSVNAGILSSIAKFLTKAPKPAVTVIVDKAPIVINVVRAGNAINTGDKILNNLPGVLNTGVQNLLSSETNTSVSDEAKARRLAIIRRIRPPVEKNASTKSLKASRTGLDNLNGKTNLFSDNQNDLNTYASVGGIKGKLLMQVLKGSQIIK